MTTSFVAQIIQGFAQAFQPLEDALGSEAAFATFMAEFGWTMAASSDINAVQSLFKTLTQNIDALKLDVQQAASAEQLTSDVVVLAGDIAGLVATAAQQNLPAPLNLKAFWDTFPDDLFEYLVYTYLETHVVFLFGILRFLGILIEADEPADVTSGRDAYTRRGVDWAALPKAVANPATVFTQLYGWGTTFHHELLLRNLQSLLQGLLLGAGTYVPTDSLLDLYYAKAAPFRSDPRAAFASPLRNLGSAGPGASFLKIVLVILPIPPKSNKSGSPDGFALFPVITGQGATKVSLAPSVDVEISGDFQGAVLRLNIHPNDVELSIDPPTLHAAASARINGHPLSPWIPLGTKDSTRLEVAKAYFGLSAHLSDSAFEYRIEGGADAGLVIDLSESDGFLQKMLGGEPLKLDLSSALSWSNRTGFSFSGQAQLEANIPVHLSVAEVLMVDTIYVALRAGTNEGNNATATLQVAASGGLNIGPVAATVDRIGLKLELTPLPKGQAAGNLGTLHLGFGFKPPNGLGLVIDAGAIVGGGYIFFDPDKGQYAGVLELSMESIQVKAIGVITTKMPDGSPGFSFLIIITTEFTPIQLGFGFTLNGVGGLVGINRTMILDALRAGFKNHALNSILFPPDPVKNAQRIISDLTTIFPPADSRYTFGPMLKIGWGSPTLLVAELGIILEIPSPVRLAILGQIKAAIPTDDAAIILLHIDVLGTIDFGLKKLAIDASIYDSRLAVFSLLGDMALRLNWGDDALFILSIGGFHPQFQPPPGFPHLARLTVSLGRGDNPRLSLEAYIAVTSNSLQFGAHLELYAGAAGFSIHGYLGFDALFIFSPFHFVVELRAGVQIAFEGLTLLGIDLDLKLSGPTPWTFDGTASLEILFFTISVHVHGSFGGGTAPELPPAPVMTPLLTALKNRQSWNAALPEGAESAVTLVSPKSDDTSLYVHPMGTLGVAQSVVPLNTPISKFGSAVPSDGDTFTFASITINTSIESINFFDGQFAPAQYRDMSDADKLSAKSFVAFPAGATIGSTDIKTGTDTDLDLEYDTQIIDNFLSAPRRGISYRPSMAHLLALAGQGAGALSLVWATGNAKFKTTGVVSSISNRDPSYVAASVVDLQVNHAITPGMAANQYQARVALESYLAVHPEDGAKYQIMLAHEAVN